jgi:hypothetical protein
MGRRQYFSREKRVFLILLPFLSKMEGIHLGNA